MKNVTIFQLIADMDSNRTAQVSGFKSLAHGCMTRAIFAIQSHMRQQQRGSVLRDSAGFEPTNDMRNAQDGDFGRESEVTRDFGFAQQISHLERATALIECYLYAKEQCEVYALTPFDVPMQVADMIDFFINNQRGLSPEILQLLAEEIGCDPRDIIKLKELENQRTRDELIESRSEILATFEGIYSARVSHHADSELRDPADRLDILTHHQLAIKVAEGLKKAQNQVLVRIMRTNRITDLGDIRLLKDALAEVSAWVDAYERKFMPELSEAMDQGRSLRTLADI